MSQASARVRESSSPAAPPHSERRVSPSGRFVDRHGQRYCAIEHAEGMPLFFTCIVSPSDHWLFASSNGCLTAGRQSSKYALFPYVTEDKIHDGVHTTGPYTALLVRPANGRGRVGSGDESTPVAVWEPFRPSGLTRFDIQRNLYKSVTLDRFVFEEHNRTLGLVFSYEWCTSERFGFVRRSRLERLDAEGPEVRVEVLDGLLNLMPALVDEQMQLGFSCLLDAYKSSEKVSEAGLATFSLASQIVDRAEPREALRATVAYGLGLPGARTLLSVDQVNAFLRGYDVTDESRVRGRRCAYLQVSEVVVSGKDPCEWILVTDVNQDQLAVERLADLLETPKEHRAAIEADIEAGTRALRAIVAQTDGIQLGADEASTAHHFANTLFNDMRGGVYADGYRVRTRLFSEFVAHANRPARERHASFLAGLAEELPHSQLVLAARSRGDKVLERLALEYLPLTFSRRHGDPSRPWNKFDIKVRDASGNRLLAFQGNWRDIFQNWEALSVSYPEYVESIITKFVNASTLDGYNPYRITESGIDWEVPEPENPWAGIGYWGDHQIVYLLKLLEMSRAHHPQRLGDMLLLPLFTYANVPYRIAPFDRVKDDPHNTISFDHDMHAQVLRISADLGSDGKLVLEAGEPVTVTLLEKLLVTSLAKMGNYIPGGGIWMNTQRPEWNDANNALVGYGVSMVTLYYLARFFHFLEDLIAPLAEESVEISAEVVSWLTATTAALGASSVPDHPGVDERARYDLVDALGQTSTRYRERVYAGGPGGRAPVEVKDILAYVRESRRHINHSVALGRRSDGLYHAYNLLRFDGDRLIVEHLYEMLEGQVAVLSSGTLKPEEALDVLRALRKSAMYRPDQDSYLLYPNRELPGFLEKNRISPELLETSALLRRLVDSPNDIVQRDARGTARFGADLYNGERLEEALRARLGVAAMDDEIAQACRVYESVFNHHAFTGRSGTMFGYEGLGSIYWHMVAKLLLAVQENYFWALERGARPSALADLARRYYEIRHGVGGFNKTPEVYGAFVVEPYSHTPEGAGARQPGMTGQVKEEVLTRFGELGVRVSEGIVRFQPSLLREAELLVESAPFEQVAPSGEITLVDVPPGALAFSYCGTLVVLRSGTEPRIVVAHADGSQVALAGDSLGAEYSAHLFARTGYIVRLDVEVVFSDVRVLS